MKLRIPLGAPIRISVLKTLALALMLWAGVGFVHHHQVTRRVRNISRLVAGKLIGADDDGVLRHEGLKFPSFTAAL
jgi:hypothetical protein